MSIKLPESKASSSLGQKEERSTIFGDKSNTFTRINLPLAEAAKLCFDDHILIK